MFKRLFKRLFKRHDLDKRKIGWNNISIRQFMDIAKVDSSDDEAYLQYLSIIEKIGMEELLNMPYQKVIDMTEDLKFLQNGPKKGIKPEKSYVLNGTKYDVLLNPDDMTTAQYIDFQMIQDYENHIPEMLSIFLIPEGKKYGDGYSIDGARKDIMEYMCIEDALTLCGFFSFWSRVYMKVLMVRLTREIKRQTRKAPNPEIKEKMKELQILLKQR